MIMIHLTHPSISSTNQENVKHPQSLITMTTLPTNLLGTSNMPTTIIQHLGQGVYPGSPAAPTEHYFVSLITIILRRYWICHTRTSKICCYYKTNFVPNAFGRCLKYSHTTHMNKFYYRDQIHLNS